MDEDSGEREPATTGAETIERRELAQVVERALLELTDEARTVLVLRDVEELSSQEVAAVLGLPDATVRQRLHRARQAVAERLRPELCEAPHIRCGGRLGLLFDFLDGLLGDDVHAPVTAHLDGCPICQALAARYRETIRAPRDASPVVLAETIDRVLARVSASLQPK